MGLDSVKFSVIIPTFNRANYLDTLLNSLCLQYYSNFEVVICDDGSTDNTKEIVDKYLSKLDLKYFYQDNWGGPARPRNVCINNSIGDFICFLDSDDLWMPDKLLKIFQSLDPIFDVYFHLFLHNENIVGRYSRKFFCSDFETLFSTGNRIVNSSLVISRKAIDSVGLINESKELIGVEDFELLLNLSYNGFKFKKVNKVLGIYQSSDSIFYVNQVNQINKTEVLFKRYYSKISKNLIKKNKALISYMYAKEEKSNAGKKLALLNFSIFNGSLLIKIKALYVLLMHLYKNGDESF
jgi:glycosyltransferase involved in cell wall biosynthesis